MEDSLKQKFASAQSPLVPTEIIDNSDPLTPTTAEDVFDDILGNIQSPTGEEGLLKLASKYALQLDGRQMRALMFAEAFIADNKCTEDIKQKMTKMLNKWLEYKQFNRSNVFVMTALDSISLRKLITENTMKINVQK